MATTTIQILDGRPAILIADSKVGDKLLLVAWLPGGNEGDQVEYERLWGAYEGEAVRVNGAAIGLELVYGGAGRTIPQIADDLGVDDDQLGFQRP